MRTSILGLTVGFGIALYCHPSLSADMKDATDFPSPSSRCMHATKGRILTSVGSFPSGEKTDFEVVADTRLTPSLGGGTEFEDPSLNVFNDTCELVWHQSYPSLAEVGFETLTLPGRLMLHVSATSVFQPVDQVISKQELLISTGDSLQSEITFGSDRYDYAYIGRVDSSGQIGVVVIYNSIPMKVGFQAISPAVTAWVYVWQPLADPDAKGESSGQVFVGPKPLSAQELIALKLPAKPQHPPFPLFKFVFGGADPG